MLETTRPPSHLFGFYLRSRPGHIVEIAEVRTMVPGIAQAMLVGRFLRVGRPMLWVLLSFSLLFSASAVNGKEKADDILENCK